MAKKKQVYFSICLNEEAVKEYNLTPEEIKELSKRYMSVNSPLKVPNNLTFRATNFMSPNYPSNYHFCQLEQKNLSKF